MLDDEGEVDEARQGAVAGCHEAGRFRLAQQAPQVFPEGPLLLSLPEAIDLCVVWRRLRPQQH